jgi:histidine triad (HIT) family protein
MPDDCLFCRIIRGEIPSSKVTESDTAFAFRDVNPQAPSHVLVVPRTHVTSHAVADDPVMLGDLMMMAASVARIEGIEESGYRVVVNTGRDGGQTVDHLHLHVLGGRHMKWPPG